MAYEQRPSGAIQGSSGKTTVRIEKSGDPGLVNAQLLNYKNLGYEIQETDYEYRASIPTEQRNEIETDYQRRGIQQVLGTRTISAEDRNDGMNLSTVETLAPVRAEDLLGTLRED